MVLKSPQVKPGLHVRRKHKHKHKKPTCKPVRSKHKRLVLALVLMLASCQFTRTTGNHASISTSTRNLRVNRCEASISALCLRLCLCLRRAGLHVRRNDASISTSTREWNDFHSLVFVLMLASYV